MARALIGLGANLGDREHALGEAVKRLSVAPGGRLLAVSRWLSTRPIGGPAGQADFLNGAALLETSQGPVDLLAALREIETALGRRRGERWEARPIDLDLLLFDDLTLRTPQIELPHPGLAFRRFVLAPAAEVAGEMRHPRIGWTIEQLLEHLNRAPQYAAIIGADGERKRLFAARLARDAGARLLTGRSALEAIPQPPAERRSPKPAASPAPSEEPLAPPDSPVHSLEQGIKLLDRWRRILAEIGGEPATVFGDSSTALSDFWWGEFPARVAELPAEEKDAALAAWRSHSVAVVEPKLLIVLAPAEEHAAALAGREPGEPANPGARAMRRLVSEILQTPGHGPILRCEAGDSPAGGAWLEAAARDAAAALEAMR